MHSIKVYFKNKEYQPGLERQNCRLLYSGKGRKAVKRTKWGVNKRGIIIEIKLYHFIGRNRRSGYYWI
jgi:hypothetical protein